VTVPPDPLHLSNDYFSAPPQGTFVSHPATASNVGTSDWDPDLRNNVAALEQSQKPAMFVPAVATDILGHPLDVASFSRDIDHSE
jgi:hypothetical protein